MWFNFWTLKFRQNFSKVRTIPDKLKNVIKRPKPLKFSNFTRKIVKFAEIGNFYKYISTVLTSHGTAAYEYPLFSVPTIICGEANCSGKYNKTVKKDTAGSFILEQFSIITSLFFHSRFFRIQFPYFYEKIDWVLVYY